MLQKSGDFHGARSAFDEDLATRRRLAAAAPNDARRQRRLAVSLAYAGLLQLWTGNVAQALAHYREEAALTSALAGRDPSNADARRQRAVAQLRVASLVDPAEALPLAETATNDLRELVRADNRAGWRRDLAAALVRLSKIRLQRNDPSRARADIEEAILLSEALVTDQPKDAQRAHILCDALLTAAAIDERESRTPLAEQRRIRAAAATGCLHQRSFHRRGARVCAARPRTQRRSRAARAEAARRRLSRNRVHRRPRPPSARKELTMPTDPPLIVYIFAETPPAASTTSPLTLIVPWKYDGTIIFTLKESPPDVKFDQQLGGVLFIDRFPPFTLIHAGEREYHFSAINDVNQPSQLGTFPYFVFLSEGYASTKGFDPTVENESPPPHIH